MIAQYYEVKESYKDAVVLFQVGGFFQAYYFDAKLLSEILHLELVGKSVGGGKIIPMCGIPKKSVMKRAEYLKDMGYRVVLCEQKEESVDEGGLRRREVSEIYEPEKILKVDLTEKWEDYLVWLGDANFERAMASKKPAKKSAQEKPLGADKLLEALQEIDLCRLTPFEAMGLLYEWKEKFTAPEY